MDRRTIVAVILIGLFLVFYYPLLGLLGLDKYLGDRQKARPVAVDTLAHAVGDTTGAAIPSSTPTLQGEAVVGATPAAAPVVTLPARQIRLETPLYSALFSTRGARLVSVELKHYASAHGVSGAKGELPPRPGKGEVPAGDRVVLAGGPTYGLDLGSDNRIPLDALVYTAQESTDASGQLRAITFTGTDTSGLEVRQTFRVHENDYAMDLEVQIRNVPASWRVNEYSLTTRSWPLFTEAQVDADERGLRATSMVGTNMHREHSGSLKTAKRFDGNAAWAGVQSRYFFAGVAVRDAAGRAVVSTSGARPLTAQQQAILGAKPRPDQPLVTNSLVSALPGELKSHRYLLYVGPSEYHRLAALKANLERAVDLGWSWIVPFSNALLALMNLIYRFVQNYGVAILALATLVRLVLHPLNMSSMKSMRAMQKLQPEIERIREKYKNDPNSMNTAIMALYKDNKVNPAGGCAPMLLQMPIFFALYSVLFNAIELRQAPFVGWIQDLSAPDHLVTIAGLPIRLLPILMLGSGLLQQKLAPTDPRQAPTMYLMNVVMLVFFYNLPSGLVLYWTVMNLLTAIQQWLVLRDGHSEVSSATVVETPTPKKRRSRG